MRKIKAILMVWLAILIVSAAPTAYADDYEVSLSSTVTTTGTSISPGNYPWNISIQFSTTGSDPGVTIQRKRITDSTWKDVRKYTSSTETVETCAPNPSIYHYRAKYTGSTGAANVRIDQ